MRKQIVAGNWKMNNDLAQTEALLSDLKKQTQSSNAEVMVDCVCFFIPCL
jgi:triosephosphate isomerase